MELVLIRHFQTPGNKKGQYIGSTDEELDETRTSAPVPEYPRVDALAVSPMKRCIQTAGIIYPQMEAVLCPLLKEVDFGEYEGKTYEELKYEPAYQRWIDGGGVGAFPGGEDRAVFQERCVRGLEELLEVLIEQGSRRAAAVVHGGTIMAVMSEFDPEKRSFYQWQVKNGGGYIVEIEEKDWLAGRRVFRKIRSLGQEMEIEG